MLQLQCVLQQRQQQGWAGVLQPGGEASGLCQEGGGAAMLCRQVGKGPPVGSSLYVSKEVDICRKLSLCCSVL